jgi:hypothetical protein
VGLRLEQANNTRAPARGNSGLRFIALSAVFSGVKDLREAIQEGEN